MRKAKIKSIEEYRSHRLNFSITNRSKDKVPTFKEFARWIDATLCYLRLHANISLLLTDEEEAKCFNLQYRNKDYATNVLSFELGRVDSLPERIIGDLLICPTVVAKEAKEQGKDILSHYAHLTVHGTLHLAGFDHMNDLDAEKMEMLEINILHRLGYDNPYNDKEC
ncbi:MAG: rRNA maturation RNase YbeY [Neisseriaceae bacterium]|nr:rRNA maturation RNase YbeY [Neisseriaceae bacterium]